MGATPQPGISPEVSSFFPNDTYELYEGPAASGILLKGIFIDDPQHTAYLADRGVRFMAPLVAAYGLVGEAKEQYDAGSAYVQALYIIGKSASENRLKKHSFNVARAALLAGQFEHTVWINLVPEADRLPAGAIDPEAIEKYGLG